jgi:2-dehydro-3-deoxyglucarate aldolase
VHAIDELLAHDAVDGAMIGPYDLSGSLGIPGQIDDPRLTDACAIVVDACRRHNKACGTQIVEVSQESIDAASKAGFTFAILASDVFILWKWSERVRDTLKTLKRR